MNGVSEGLIIGTTVGVVIGVLLAVGILLCMRYRRSQAQIRSSSSRRSSTIPIRANGVNTCAELSNSTTGQESPREFEDRGPSLWIEGPGRKSLISASGIPKYAYKELQKATSNFTKLLGQGAFGPVYKADMSSGEILAVKVLANNSKQGEKSAPLRWDFRVNIALDVARGLEYLHDGAVPPVVHRDIKSPNILLDQSMHARVADFGLSREEMLTRNGANIRGTYGYLDPEYVSSRSFTKKSDVYSYGVLLFELIAGRNPQQGLMEYVELAAINADGKTGWEEIADSRLEGAFDVEELNDMAAAAYKCVSRVSRKRPSMRDVVQALIRVAKHSHSSRNHHGRRLPPGRTDDESVDLEASEDQSSASGHQRQESVGSVSELPDV
uniref:Protein kinase domain-containing protein n=1 Tax=Aegilops tauschii subsp. strangulata TaxID=200361 RepID=A0A453RZM5_AEGTS